MIEALFFFFFFGGGGGGGGGRKQFSIKYCITGNF